MNLYILKPKENLEHPNPWDTSWMECVHGVVVRAENSMQARKLANGQPGDEGRHIPDVWLNPAYTTCRRMKAQGKVGVIIVDGRGD